MITVTENAVEQIKKLQTKMSHEGKPLRVAVVGGGCSGNQYSMGFDDEKEGDSKFETGGVTVLVDDQSLAMLDGIELDFVENIQGSNFVFNNPNATGSCGCGNSFSA